MLQNHRMKSAKWLQGMFVIDIISPWVIKNPCTRWGPGSDIINLRDYNRRTKARCRTVPNPRFRTVAHILFTKICKCFLTCPKEASVGFVA